MEIIAGIDVGKQWLDVSIDGGLVKRFYNTREGIVELVLHGPDSNARTIPEI